MKAVLISLQTKIKNKEDDWHAASRNGSCVTKESQRFVTPSGAACECVVRSHISIPMHIQALSFFQPIEKFKKKKRHLRILYMHGRLYMQL